MKKIEIVSNALNIHGGKCPEFKRSQIQRVIMAVYFLMLGGLIVMGVSRSVTVLGARLLE